MKAIICTAVFLLVFAAISLATEEAISPYLKLDIPVKKLLKDPVDTAKSSYDIPIGVRIIGKSNDGKWYKIRISYNFLGYYEYEGWLKSEY